MIPPRVLILALRAIIAPGTKNGMHAHSPVLEAMLHMVHGKHNQVIKPEETLNKVPVKQLNRLSIQPTDLRYVVVLLEWLGYGTKGRGLDQPATERLLLSTE